MAPTLGINSDRSLIGNAEKVTNLSVIICIFYNFKVFDSEGNPVLEKKNNSKCSSSAKTMSLTPRLLEYIVSDTPKGKRRKVLDSSDSDSYDNTSVYGCSDNNADDVVRNHSIIHSWTI